MKRLNKNEKVYYVHNYSVSKYVSCDFTYFFCMFIVGTYELLVEIARNKNIILHRAIQGCSEKHFADRVSVLS
jgi:hypothetical protein